MANTFLDDESQNLFPNSPPQDGPSNFLFGGGSTGVMFGSMDMDPAQLRTQPNLDDMFRDNVNLHNHGQQRPTPSVASTYRPGSPVLSQMAGGGSGTSSPSSARKRLRSEQTNDDGGQSPTGFGYNDIDSPIYSQNEASHEGGSESPSSPNYGAAAVVSRRRKKHNEGETRRRKALNLKFHDLKLLVNSPNDTKPAILKDTSKYIINMRAKLDRYTNILGSVDLEENKINDDDCVQENRSVIFRNIFTRARAPRLLTDIAGVIVACNEVFAQLVGHSRSSLLSAGRTHASILESNCRNLVANVLKSLLVGKRRSGHVKLVYITSQGQVRNAIASVWLSPYEGKTFFDHALHCNVEE